MGRLADYFSKRRFSETPEPKGASAGQVKRRQLSPRGKLLFVVQEHHASSLHYDFRLEMDGVLKSWAVPKGPSMDPHVRHLAVMTEDHPYEYRKFEGTIPDGHYGAGNVIIWDEGWYEPRAETDNPQKTLLKELHDGHITFILHGQKLQGEFALIKLHAAAGKQDNGWLLIKKGDAYAGTEDITAQNTSVKSHRTVDSLGDGMPDISGYPATARPWEVRPMLATLLDKPFSKAGWIFEIKWDGYRAVGSKHGSDVSLYSRAGNDFMRAYAPVAEALRGLRHDVILDGEIVVTDESGRAHFEWLQNWHREPRGTLQYYVFDILWCDGHDIRTMPLSGRKALLSHIIPKHTVLHVSEDIPENGLGLFREMQKRGVEGMVAKRADSPYSEHQRGNDWLKVKTQLRQEVVIGGYTEPRGGRKYLGSLLVGVYENGNFIYTGHSGGGIPDDLRRQLRDKLQKLERANTPFKVKPKPNAPVHWTAPKLVCEMSFSEWTEDGLMRHPQFMGMRSDKPPVNVHRELPAHTPAAKKPAPKAQRTTNIPFDFTHPDKIFFPRHKYTKQDLFDYYATVASYILPYVQDRPCSLLRMPHGIRGESFFQKNNDHLPGWATAADIFSESNKASLHWLVGGGLHTLLYMVQLGCVEINPWNSRVQQLDKPDWLVIDLDPEGVPFSSVINVAKTVHEVCDGWHIPAYPKTSGKTGLHIYVPLQAKYSYEQCKNLAHLIAIEVNRRQPGITSLERMPEKRKHRIYLDFLQNREGQTLAAPYSVRPVPDASVSTPLTWDEVKPGLLPVDFTIANMPARLKKVGDLWRPVMQRGINLAAVLTSIEQSKKNE